MISDQYVPSSPALRMVTNSGITSTTSGNICVISTRISRIRVIRTR